MTKPLRRAHLRIWILLSILLPALLALGLSARPAEPVNPNLHWEKLP